jgi:SAM-dependent methyltransferase
MIDRFRLLGAAVDRCRGRAEMTAHVAMTSNAQKVTDDVRLREFWNSRYAQFTLSESGWLGAGERLNRRIYAGKRQALRRALGSLGLTKGSRWSVLDAGCGQGHFARFYRTEYPAATYVGVDISERAVAYLRHTLPDAEFHLADLAEWDDPSSRTFEIVQSLDVLYLILDDDVVVRALANLTRRLSAHGAMFVTAAMPDTTLQPSDYLRHRSRSFWESTLQALGLRIVSESPMYYWLPDGLPRNKYVRYALTQLGPDALYTLDRAALALGLPQLPSAGIDCRTRLLTIQRT